MAGTAHTIFFILLFGLSNISCANHLRKHKVGHDDGLIERITTDALQNQQNQSADTMMVGYPIKFVSLFTILAGLLNTFLIKLGQVKEAIEKLPPKNSTHENLSEIAVDESVEDEENPEGEEDYDDVYLLECDANHLGLWPDKSNSQRYYKCEVDPRTPSLGNCIQDYFRERKDNKTTIENSQQGTFVPLVKPCFLLTILKCANGYKYSHKTRICIPDVIFN